MGVRACVRACIHLFSLFAVVRVLEYLRSFVEYLPVCLSCCACLFAALALTRFAAVVNRTVWRVMFAACAAAAQAVVDARKVGIPDTVGCCHQHLLRNELFLWCEVDDAGRAYECRQ